MSASNATEMTKSPRQGVVAVCRRATKFLVIRRAENVEAPGMFCFPGGGLEAGETEEQALQRELLEELGCHATKRRHLWRSQTAWNVDLSWWQIELLQDAVLTPNPLEVASVHWFAASELRELPSLLSSNLAFLVAWESDVFKLK